MAGAGIKAFPWGFLFASSIERDYCLLHSFPNMKPSLLPLLPFFVSLASAATDAPAWRFNLIAESSGIVALESVIVNPNLALFFDRASDDPLQINGHSAWGALFNLQTAEVSPLNVVTNSFCASGAFLSNGTMVSTLIPARGQTYSVADCRCRRASAETKSDSRETRSSSPGIKPSGCSLPAPRPLVKAARSSKTPTSSSSRSGGTLRPPESSMGA